MIYFLKVEGFDLVKIGFTKKLSTQRLYAYDNHSPFNHELLLLIEGSMEDEKNLHKKFKEHKLNNKREWFNLSNDILNYIDNSKAQNLDLSKKVNFVKGTRRRFTTDAINNAVQMYANDIALKEIASFLDTSEKSALVLCLIHGKPRRINQRKLQPHILNGNKRFRAKMKYFEQKITKEELIAIYHKYPPRKKSIADSLNEIFNPEKQTIKNNNSWYISKDKETLLQLKRNRKRMVSIT